MTTQTVKGTLRISPVSLNISTHKHCYNARQSIYLIFLYKNYALKTIPIKLASPSSLSFKWSNQKSLVAAINVGEEEIIEIALLTLSDSACADSLPNVLSRVNLNLTTDEKILNLGGGYSSNFYHLEFLNHGMLDIIFEFKSSAPCLPPKLPSFSVKDETDTDEIKAPQVDPYLVLQKVYDTHQVEDEERRHFKAIRNAGTYLKRNHRKWKNSLHAADNDDESIFEATITSTERLTINHINLSDPRPSITSIGSTSSINSTTSPSSASPTDSTGSSFSAASRNNNIPYSASSIGQTSVKDLPLPPSQQQYPPPAKPMQLSPQTYKLLTSISEGHPPISFFQDLIQPGLSQYKGDANWDKDRLRDSMINLNSKFYENGDNRGIPPPRLPPKVPLGLTKQEWFVLRRDDVIGYIKEMEGYSI